MFKSIAFKFFLVLLGILVLAFFVLEMWIGNLIEDAQIERSKNNLASFVQAQASNLLEPQSFVFGSERASRERFTDFFNIVRTPEIVRVKVWDTSSLVVYSDDESIIGQNFPDNTELSESLEGEIEAEIQKPMKPENAAEVGYTQLMEVYVPIYFDGIVEPVGVIELYFNLDETNRLLAGIKMLVIRVMLFTIVTVWMAIWLSFWFLVRRRIKQLNLVAIDVAGGNMGAQVKMKEKDEIGELAIAFNFMTARLKELHENLERKVKERTEELEKDNRAMIGREVKMVELKKEIEELKKEIKDLKSKT